MKRLKGFKIPTGFFFIVSLVAIGSCAAPTVTFEDSGEFISTAYLLGIPHPSGYPLYILLGKLFTMIPFGEIGWRVNMLSVFFAALTVEMAFHISREVCKSKKVSPPLTEMSGLFSGVFLLASGLFWSQSVISEVYTLNAFFVSLLIFSLIKMNNGSLKYIPLSFFVLGLGLGNHLTLVFMLPLVIFFAGIILIKDKHKKKMLILLAGGAFLFVVGFSVYFTLLIRSNSHPPLNWGTPGNVSLLTDVILQKEFKGIKQVTTLNDTLFKCRMFADNLRVSYGKLLLVVLIPGIFLFTARREMFIFLYTFCVYFLGTGLLYNVEKNILYSIYVFFIPSHLVLSLWGGCGSAFLLNMITGNKKNIPLKEISALVIIITILFLSAGQIYTSSRKNDKRNYYYAYDWGINIIKSVENESTVFTRIDNDAFPLYYFTEVLGMKPGIVHLNVTFLERNWYRNEIKKIYPGKVYFPAGKFTLTEMIEKIIQLSAVNNKAKGKGVYLVNIPDKYINGTPLSLEGVVFRVKGSALPEYRSILSSGFELVHRGLPAPIETLDREVRRKIPGYIAAYSALATFYNDRNMPDKSIKCFNKLLRFAPNDPKTFSKIGFFYMDRGEFELSLSAFDKALPGLKEKASIYLNMGYIYSRLNKKEDEKRVYLKSLEIKKDYVKAYINLGVYYIKSGSPELAVETWKKGLKYEPGNPVLNKYLSSVRIKK